MKYLKLTDWDENQSYRKDRGTPPWIKTHRKRLTDANWGQLSDSEKGQLGSIELAAADTNGIIPEDPKLLKKICGLDKEPNLLKLKALKFLSLACQPDDNQMTTICQPDDAPETETETETEVEEHIVEKEILEYLNLKANKKFKPVNNNLELIAVRVSEGYSKEDFFHVIDVKCSQWLGDKENDKYLRPSTLFRSSKFPGYANEKIGLVSQNRKETEGSRKLAQIKRLMKEGPGPETKFLEGI